MTRNNTEYDNGSAVAVSRGGNDLGRFFLVVGSVVGTFLLVASVAAFGYVRSANAAAKPYLEHLAQNETAQTDAGSEPDPNTELAAQDDESGFMLPQRKTNFLVMGYDEALLTDTIMVGCFDRETKKIDIISIPRDTYVTLPKSTIAQMQKEGRKPPSSGIMKINAVNAYGGDKEGFKYIREYLESMLGIKIDYYAGMDTEAFRQIVDDIGGVDMEIPAGGLHYWDPTQNLRINVPGGMVHLNGEMAEGVVRYRATYRQGDLQRLGVQHEFLKLLLEQVLKRETVINNAPSLINTFITYVKTDFSVLDAPKYLRYITSIDPDNFSACTLPGYAKNVPASDGSPISYYFVNEAETQDLVNSIFFNFDESVDAAETDLTEESSEPEASSAPNSKIYAIADEDLNIQVLNGGNINGMAAKKQDMLEAQGFNVVNIDTYTGSQKDETRVVARDKETARRLAKYFVNVTLETDPDLSSQYDIVVVIGLDEV